jgi:glyoxylase-like metal-dependent hydrolase (beta-lactamase superfamily II)
MKSLHRPDLYCWSKFDLERNVDFNGWCWTRSAGNVLIDPMPMIDHDLAHLTQLGGAAIIVITNSDHTRASLELKQKFGAQLVGPRAEEATFPFPCDRWVGDGETIVPGLVALELEGSKTPGELALLLEETTLFTGDLVRAHKAGSLMMLPDPKIKDRQKAVESVQRLAGLTRVEAVLVGDGWPMFHDGREALAELAGAQRQRIQGSNS